MVDWTDFNPTVQEVREEREKTGEGMVPIRRRIMFERMSQSLAVIDEGHLDATTQTILAVLKALVYDEQEARRWS